LANGDDVYIVSQSDIVLVELANTAPADQGIDLVKSNVSFTLGDNLENLTLIGNSNIRGTGNALNTWFLATVKTIFCGGWAGRTR
jgi:serralysin